MNFTDQSSQISKNKQNRHSESLINAKWILNAFKRGIMSPIDLVKKQAEDEGLWINAQTSTEAYLIAALRKLHAAVEFYHKEEVEIRKDQTRICAEVIRSMDYTCETPNGNDALYSESACIVFHR